MRVLKVFPSLFLRKEYKFQTIKIRMKKTIIVVAIILVLAGIVILSNGQHDLSSKDGIFSFVKAYGIWAKTVVGNVVDVTGYAIRKPWIPQ